MYVLYSYIEHPDNLEIDRFIEALFNSENKFSHLGKNDPPKKFDGSKDSAVKMILGGTEITNYTFAKFGKGAPEITFQLRKDCDVWPNSTISASCDDAEKLERLDRLIASTLKPYIAVLGVAGDGKIQEWKILREMEECPQQLRAHFYAT